MIALWGSIVGGTEYTSGEAGSTTDSWWTYTDDVTVYRTNYLRGQITSNFSMSVNISLITDGGILPVLVDNLTKSVPLDSEETLGETLDFALPTGGLLIVTVRSIQEGNFRNGMYFIRIDVQSDSMGLLSTLLPYILLGLLSLALSFLRRGAILRDYLVKSRDQDYLEVGFTVLLSLLFFNPSERVFPGEPHDIIGGIADSSYAAAWWIYVAVSVSLYLNLQKKFVQNLWAYPRGKSRVYLWRLVELVKRVWSVSVQTFVYYFAIVYLDLSGRRVTADRMIGIAEIVVSNALIAMQYALVVGLLFMAFRNVNLIPIVVLLLYYIVDYLGILPIRLSRLGKSDLNWWTVLLLPVTIAGSSVVLRRLYMSAEVIS